ncbi:unnamed protein product [Symbiodinium microadriaticum]|nr:unnamed protein product [Symbiodinium microadriaticum]CAE7943580.1 unnamed protein product [Symbiodinium sp. KB8]
MTPLRTLPISSGWTGIWIQVRLVVPRRTVRRTTSTVRSTMCSTSLLGPMERTDLRWARRCLWASRERTCLWTLQRRFTGRGEWFCLVALCNSILSHQFKE